MLTRAFRLTDKLGLVFFKLGIGASHLWLEGIHSLLNGAGLVIRPVLRTAWQLLRFIVTKFVALLAAIVGLIVFILRGVLTFLGSTLALMGRAGAVGMRKTAGGIVTATQKTGQLANEGMARRSARQEMRVKATEDPLKAQNRLLSYAVVALFFALVALVLWATAPGRGDATPLNLASDTNPLAGNPDVPISTVAVAQLSTLVPTATAVPEILTVRGSLAYTVRERGQTDIWGVSVGSRQAVRLTNSPADERDPSWSPDRTRPRLAYASNKEGNWELYVYDLASNQTTRMTYDLSFQGAPSWSPDGLWLVYESYQGNNLDVYLVPVDGSRPADRVTDSAAPDFSPVWSPDGRKIAFVSWRDGNQDIYVFSLDNPVDSASVNITRTPERQEDYPAWSPDGKLLAYSALDQGIEKVFVKAVADPNQAAQVIAQGRMPAWSPDGSSLVYAVDTIEGTQFVAVPFTQSGVAALVVGANMAADEPTWTSNALPATLTSGEGLPLGAPQNLYIEQESRQSDGLFRLGPLDGVVAPVPNLSDRVNDSFNALRRRVNVLAGWDFLGQLEDAFWRIDRPPQPGEERRNWLMTGRAFALDRQLIRGFPPQIELVREDIGIDTYWRVYVRVTEDAQDGQLGEPLRRMTWDMLSRDSGDLQAYDQGGRLRTEMPAGYYVDLTQAALDYGWEWMAAGTDWRANFNSVNYWLYRKTDGLDWYQAMLELYTLDQMGGLAPTATPK